MSQQNARTDPKAIAERVNGFDELYPRHVGGAKYSVLSTRNDSITAHTVNIEQLTCGCEDEVFNQEGSGVCDHVAVAVHAAPKRFTLDMEAAQFLLEAMQQVNYSRGTPGQRFPADEAMDPDGTDSDDAGASDGADSGADDDDDDDGAVDESLTADKSQRALMTQLEEWIDAAQQFNGNIDPEIVVLEWAEAEGAVGISIDRAPFAGSATYYDDGAWQDKEGYETARDAVGDLLSSNPEFRWYGEPDYRYFIPATDISEVVG